MKKKLLSLVIVAAMTSNVYAADMQDVALLPGIVASAQSPSIDVTPALNAIDMQAAFQQDAQPMQLAALSGQEMKETQGAFGWFAVLAVLSVANTIWGATTRSQQDRRTSRTVGVGLSFAQCGLPVCNPFRAYGRAYGSWRFR